MSSHCNLSLENKKKKQTKKTSSTVVENPAVTLPITTDKKWRNAANKINPITDQA